MLPFDDEQNRALANLAAYYEQWIAAARELDGPCKGSMRWKVVSGKQYLYHRVSANPLVDNSIGRRSPQTEARMLAFQQGKAAASARHARAQAEAARFARVVRALGLGLAPSPAARLLRHLDRRGMLGHLLLVVGTIAMSAYEVEAGARIFRGFDATQDVDLAWRGRDALQLQTTGQVSVLGTLREVDPLFTKNTERGFQAVSGKYEVEVLAAPSTLASFPKDDLVPIAGMAEQEWLLLGTPVRHVISAIDGTPAPVVAPDPRWMSLHKLWLSQKPQRQATKKPKDQAQGLLLMRAVVERMPGYPLDDAFVSAVPAELKGHLRMGVDWALAHRSVSPRGAIADEFSAGAPAGPAGDVLRRIRRVAAAVPLFAADYAREG
ncbi:MAG: hypothetical protein JNM90_20540 [Burkholderiales bacterium]|nr:hypothetical protein [Burkholderiales bacterium]